MARKSCDVWTIVTDADGRIITDRVAGGLSFTRARDRALALVGAPASVVDVGDGGITYKGPRGRAEVSW